MSKLNAADRFFASTALWHEELIKLRKIVTSMPLEKTVKWGAPCYTYKNKNIVGISAFRSYVGLWFFQGALLRDPGQVLVNAQAGKTKAMRQWRFQSVAEIKVNAVKAYLKEAMALVDSVATGRAAYRR